MQDSLITIENKMGFLHLCSLIFLPALAAAIPINTEIPIYWQKLPIVTHMIILIYSIIYVPFSFRKLKKHFSKNLFGKIFLVLYATYSTIICFFGCLMLCVLIAGAFSYRDIGTIMISIFLSILFSPLLIFVPKPGPRP
jgi:cellulose synthase/poly-beta-1,6-N-acetylglucosamine synthase-like glycosyltransferase